ncbi:MAG: twin-arginine translocation pathway signal [Xanthobacteraceae bacterium]
MATSRAIIDQDWAQGVARGAAVMLLAASLTGCAANLDNVGLATADPLKYELYNCKQLAVALEGANKRERELRELIGKAEHDAGGTIVATLAYKNDYARTRGDIKVVQDTMERRDCSKDTQRGGIAAIH